MQPFGIEMNTNRYIRLGLDNTGKHSRHASAPLYFNDSNSDSSLSVGD